MFGKFSHLPRSRMNVHVSFLQGVVVRFTAFAKGLLTVVVLSNLSFAQQNSYFQTNSSGKLKSFRIDGHQEVQQDGVSVVVQDAPKNELLDVPAPPNTQVEKPKQPSLEVKSNAEFIDDRCYKKNNNWCSIKCTPDRIFGCTPGGVCVGGWFNLGYHSNSNGLFNQHPNHLFLHQGYAHVEKFAQRGNGFDWGFRFDVIYGVDGQDLQATRNSPQGAPDDWDNSFDHGVYGWAFPQAFMEFATGSILTKAGYFYAPFGQESLMAVDNFFYSRTFARFYSRPRTMTGIISEIDTNMGTLFGGFSVGWNSAFENIGDATSFVGGIRRQMANGSCLLSTFTVGESGVFGSAYGSTTSITTPLGEKLFHRLDLDFYETDAFDDIGVTNQMVFQFNRCLGVGSRLEYYRTDRFGGDRSTWGWTNGFNLKPHQNIVVRPEVRLDWGPAAPTTGKAIFAADAIILF